MSVFVRIAATGGFIVLHASQIMPKNTSSVLVTNLLSLAVSTIVFWACGFAFAVGDGTKTSSNFFLAHTRFFLIDATDSDYTKFVEVVLILNLIIVIANSGFISRLRSWIYPILVTLIAGFLFPCVWHWVKAEDGWLAKGMKVVNGQAEVNLVYYDEYGGGYIHVFAGSCSLIATILVGKRQKHLRKQRHGNKFEPLGGNLNSMMVIGGMLALVGLIAKNSMNEQGIINNLAIINNLLGAQGSALVAFSLKRGKYCGDRSATKSLINGALAGVIGVSCAPGLYHPYAGFVVGVVAGLAYVTWSALFHLCHVDDPTDSAAVHLGAGLWATLAAPIFSKKDGICYDGGSKLSFQLFGWNLLGSLAIFVWAGLTLFLLFVPFCCSRIAKYQEDSEMDGLDMELDDPAFPEHDQYSGGSVNYLNSIIPPAKAKSFKIGSYDNSSMHATLERPPWGYQKEDEWKKTNY